MRRIIASMGALVLMTSGAFAQCNGHAVELQCTISSWSETEQTWSQQAGSIGGSDPYRMTAHVDCVETSTGNSGDGEVVIHRPLIPVIAAVQGNPPSSGQVTICLD